MGYLRVYVNSSFCKGICQTGFSYVDPDTRRMYFESSDVFTCENNNDSELYGIYLAIMTIYERHGHTKFKVFNDNVIACGMLDSGKNLSRKISKDYPTLSGIKKEFNDKGIIVKTVRVSRQDSRLKLVDKLSKSYRKKK